MSDTHTFDFSEAKAPPAALELSVVANNADRFSAGFAAWLDQNWHVWREFKRQADGMRGRGFTHYSARTILHWMRHHTTIYETGGTTWKLNDHVSPDLGRLYALVYPSHATFFEFRVMHNSPRAA